MPITNLLNLKITGQARKHPSLFCQFVKLLALFVGITYTYASSANNMDELTAAVQATLTHHPAILGKRDEVQAKQYAGDTARAQRLPSLNATLASHDDDTNPRTLNVRQPLWAFGRIQDGIDVADADVKTEKADLLRVQRQLMQQTAEAYVRLRGVKQQFQIATENAEALDTFHHQISRRQSGQLASAADVRLSLARYTQASVRKERLFGDVNVAETELLALTQIPIQVNQSIPALLTSLPGNEETETLAQANSTELKLKSQQVQLARANADRERTASMPTLYLQAEHRYKVNEFDDDETRLGVVLEGNIDGLGFAPLGRSKAARARLHASQQELNATRIEVTRNVRSLVSNRTAQQKMLDTLQVSVSELENILASYQRQYEAGHKAWLDVLNIQRELSEQRLQQSQAESDLLIYSARLLALTGALDPLAAIQED